MKMIMRRVSPHIKYNNLVRNEAEEEMRSWVDKFMEEI